MGLCRHRQLPLEPQGRRQRLRQLVAGHSGKCLTLSGGAADGANYVQTDCGATTGADNLKFLLRPPAPSRWSRRTAARPLGVSGSASPAVQQPVTKAASQQWTIVPKPYGKVQLKNVATGACLAVSLSAKVLSGHAQVLQWDCSDQAHLCGA